MAQLKIVKSDEVQPQNIRGLGKEAGQIKRIIATDKFFFNVDEVSPGFSPHHWHTHTKYKTDSHEVEYPADFEEIYFILSGRGVIQWKTESGEIREQEVGPGDTIHMPPGVVEHQLLNNGTEKIRLAVVGVPPPRRTPIQAEVSPQIGQSSRDLPRKLARLEQELRRRERRERHLRLAINLCDDESAAAEKVAKARQRVELWRSNQACSPFYIDRWSQLLGLAPREMAKQMSSLGEWEDAMFQNSPWSWAWT